MPHANITKKVRWEGLELCAICGQTRLFVGQVEASRVVEWCRMRKVGGPGA